jgi:hypothetical protein
VLTRLSLKAVNNAIDKKTVSAVAGEEGGGLLDARALVSLSLERRLSDRIAPELRRRVFDALAGSPRNVVSLKGGLVKIDLRGPRRELWRRRCANCAVPVWSSAIPRSWAAIRCFAAPAWRSTWSPSLWQQAPRRPSCFEGYPRLTAEMIRLAPIYAAAYPLRGRPRNQPWRDQKPVHRARLRLDTIAVSWSFWSTNASASIWSPSQTGHDAHHVAYVGKAR